MLGIRFSKPLTLLAASALALGVAATTGAAARPASGAAAPRRRGDRPAARWARMGRSGT